MAIKLKNGAEFLHIPKTGGTWVSSILNENNLISSDKGHKHADYDANLFDFDSNLFPMGKGRKRNLLLLLSLLKTKGIMKDTSHLNQPFRFCFVRHPLLWYESWWKFMETVKWRDFGKTNSPNMWHPNAILNGLGSSDFNEFIWNVIQKRPGYVSELFMSYTKSGINFIGRTESLNQDMIDVLNILDIEIDTTKILKAPKFHESRKLEVEWDPKLRDMMLKLELPSLIHYGYLNEKEQLEYGLHKYISPNKALHLNDTF
ncbi:MAG: hypothetical protein ACSHXF_13235 [Aquaticitalea sp.]